MLKRHLKILDCNTDNKSIDESALKIAFASNDMKQVNQHFGSAESLIIYTVSAQHKNIFEVVQFGDLSQDGNEDKLLLKMKALEGCAAVYFQAIGASAVRQLKALGVQPLKVASGTKIMQLLKLIQEEMCNGSTSWLGRVIESQKPHDPQRFNAMEVEGWDE